MTLNGLGVGSTASTCRYASLSLATELRSSAHDLESSNPAPSNTSVAICLAEDDRCYSPLARDRLRFQVYASETTKAAVRSIAVARLRSRHVPFRKGVILEIGRHGLGACITDLRDCVDCWRGLHRRLTAVTSSMQGTNCATSRVMVDRHFTRGRSCTKWQVVWHCDVIHVSMRAAVNSKRMSMATKWFQWTGTSLERCIV